MKGEQDMRKESLLIVVVGAVLLVIVAVVVVPASASGQQVWWNDTVNIFATAQLEPYRDSYWAAMLRPGYLKCESASLTIGNDVYIGSVVNSWWFLRRCWITFTNIPANNYGTITINYIANGSRVYQRQVYIGKTWLSFWRIPKLYLPWSPLDQ